jgi:ubiquinone/menaquinone biosynthesis C-methylase UbiE
MDNKNQAFGYLCIDSFMADVVSARALTSAFEIGLINDLLQHQPCSIDSLNSRLKIEPRGLRLLIDMLRAGRVIDQQDEVLTLSGQFSAALLYRDLLETKLYFANLVTPDFLNLFTALITKPRQFFEQAKIFELFSYQHCFQPTDQNYALTARWMRITTALTKYEAPVCMKYHDFSRYRRQLDIGGNSGEFVLRICKAHPNLQATVYDLPLVCDIGARHIVEEPEAGRISFIKTNGSGEPIPQGFDLVTFKSMLHDWPDIEMEAFLAKAYHSLIPDGTLLIFERGQFKTGDALPPYSIIPVLLFFRSYRSPGHYKTCLEKLGFRDIKIMEIQLEMPFILITATK